MEKIKDGGPAFPYLRKADPIAIAQAKACGMNIPEYALDGGMSIRDYAEIHFASAWAIALGTSPMADSRESRTAEANWLGRIQADEFIAAREAKS